MAFDITTIDRSKQLNINILPTEVSGTLTDFPYAGEVPASSKFYPDLIGNIHADTVFLLDAFRADGYTEFEDSSPSNHTITPGGAVKYSTTQAIHSISSVYFDGTSDEVLTIADSDDWNITSDFTIRFWIYTGDSGLMAIANQWDYNSTASAVFASSSFELYKDASNYLVFRVSNGTTGTTLTSTSTINGSSWVHCEVCNDGGTLRLFIDGTSEDTDTAPTITTCSRPLLIGQTNDDGTIGECNGYIQGFEIINGTALHSANFTVPVALSSRVVDTRKFGIAVDGTQLPVEVPVEETNYDIVAHYPPEFSSTYVDTTNYMNTSAYPWFAFDPSKTLINAAANASWFTADSSGNHVNVKLTVDYGREFVAKRLYYQNYHDWGGQTTRGPKRFILYGSNSPFLLRDTTNPMMREMRHHEKYDYGPPTLDKQFDVEIIYRGEFKIHETVNGVDPEYLEIPDNEKAYRYYCFHFLDTYGHTTLMGMRHLELHGYTPFYFHTKLPSVSTTSGAQATLYWDESQDDNVDFVGVTGQEGEDIFSTTNTTNFASSSIYRMTIAPAGLTDTNFIQLQLGRAGVDVDITDCWIGHSDPAGDTYDFDGNQVRVTFDGGSTGTTVTTTNNLSDVIDFQIDSSRYLVISISYNGNIPYVSNPANCTCAYGGGTVDADNWTGPTVSGNWTGVDKVIAAPPNVAAWNPNFAAVYHLEQDPSGGTDCILDSTFNKNNGTPYGSMTSADLVDSEIGNKAIDFDGSGDYIQIAHSASLNISTHITLETVCYPTDVTNEGILHKGTLSNDQGVYQLAVVSASTGWRFRMNGAVEVAKSNPSTNTWAYLVGTYNGANQILYFDGEEVDNDPQTGAISTDTNPLRIGVYYASGYTFSGKIAEVRISNVARSAAWVDATNKNLIGQLGYWSTVPYVEPDYSLSVTIPAQNSELVDFPLRLTLGDSSGTTDLDVTDIISTLGDDYQRLIVVDPDNRVIPVEMLHWDNDRYIDRTLPQPTTDYAKTSRQWSGNEAWKCAVLNISEIDSSYGWLAAFSSSYTTNQKISFDYGEAFVASRLVYTNWHHFGGQTNYGIKNAVIYGTNERTAFLDTTYASTTDLVEIATHQFQEIQGNFVQPRVINFSHTEAYRYYVIRIADNWGDVSNGMGVRRINFQERATRAVINVRSTLKTSQVRLEAIYNPNNPINPATDSVGSNAGKKVYNDGYVAVWNLANNINDTNEAWVVDSTKNEYHGTSVNLAWYDRYYTKYGKLISVDSTESITTPAPTDASTAHDLSFQSADPFTIECVYGGTDSTANGDYGAGLVSLNAAAVKAGLVLRSGYLEYIHYNSSTWQHNISSTSAINDDILHALGYTNNSNLGDLYVDGGLSVGNQDSTIESSGYFSAANLMIGYDGIEALGRLGVVRISNVARSGAWHKAFKESFFDELVIWKNAYNPYDYELTIPGRTEELVDYPVLAPIGPATGLTQFDGTRLFGELDGIGAGEGDIEPTNHYPIDIPYTHLDASDYFDTVDDGDPPDPNKWYTTITNGTITVQAGTVHHEITSAIGTLRQTSIVKLTGDFDVQVSISRIDHTDTATWLGELQMYNTPHTYDATNDAYVCGMRYDGTWKYYGEIFVGGVSAASTSYTTSLSDGRAFRIKRVGTTVTCMRFLDSSWFSLTTYASCGTDPVHMCLTTYTSSSQSLKIGYQDLMVLKADGFEGVVDNKQDTSGIITNMAITEGGPYGKYLAGGSTSPSKRIVDFGASEIPFKAISLWFESCDDSLHQPIVSDGADHHFYLNGTSLTVIAYDGGNYNSFGLAAHGAGTWNHLVITEGTTSNAHWAWLNGVRSTTEETSNFGGEFRLLGRDITNATYGTPNLTNIQVFDSVPTADQIRTLYKTGSKRFQTNMLGSDTVLYIESNHANGSTDIVDSGPDGRKVTVGGNVQHITSDSKFSKSVIDFPGSSGDVLTIPNSSELASLTGDFCIQMWVKFDTITGTHALFSKVQSFATLSDYWVAVTSTGQMRFIAANATVNITSAAAIVTTGKWYHIACVVYDNYGASDARIYVNGQSVISNHNDCNNNNTTSDLYIGGRGTSTELFDGKMQGIELTIGSPVYKGPFPTPICLPSAPNYRKLVITKGEDQLPMGIDQWETWDDTNLNAILTTKATLDEDDTVLVCNYDPTNEEQTGYTDSRDGITTAWRHADVMASTYSGTMARRVSIDSAHIDNYGDQIRVYIKGSNLNMYDCYIGLRASSGDLYDYEDGTQVPLTVNGSNDFTANTAGCFTDWIDFPIKWGDSIVVAFQVVSGEGSIYYGGGIPSNSTSRYKSGTPNENHVANVTGYSTTASIVCVCEFQVRDQPSITVWNDTHIVRYGMLRDPSSGIVYDSAGKHDAIAYGTMASNDLVDAPIGYALEFNGSSQYVSPGSLGTTPTDFTVECKFLPKSITNYENVYSTNRLGGNNAARMELGTGGSLGSYIGDAGGYTPMTHASNTIVSDEWYYSTVSLASDDSAEAYLDGDSTDTDTITRTPSFSNVAIGSGYSTSAERWFTGQVAEFRISNVIRSDEWINTTDDILNDNLITFTQKQDLYVAPVIPPIPPPPPAYDKPTEAFYGFGIPNYSSILFPSYVKINKFMLPKYSTFSGNKGGF